mmetsp:Transcript_27338/g.82014  ORF Transcript_27338/g.82014 Transcript_27338/m.82014 type:complete len:113 (+) Transcript_27338:95-433(+)|eukprot:CAMPEP_0119267666 /NCGR_PEP_ID=MMETSP1329-20130426/5723_1 /TAXON_ID=114041 /ORGANISM="Genus nov. species nov., Strain RCC1024" /LENGTH=112 /DNA_ID=CAMNT_0007267603 /DNA_START=84 /DNA_END=422 /DNA_ORIENTATION=-
MTLPDLEGDEGEALLSTQKAGSAGRAQSSGLARRGLAAFVLVLAFVGGIVAGRLTAPASSPMMAMDSDGCEKISSQHICGPVGNSRKACFKEGAKDLDKKCASWKFPPDGSY